MPRKALLGLAFGLAASCAYAQTAPSPADVGISKGTPDVFKLKGHDGAWTPFGSVDPTTHVFAPGTNGNIAPGDCLKWGPGITTAGGPCGSGGGGGGGGGFAAVYTSHSGLVNNVTTPSGAAMVMQQGFYSPGDGGQATYQWNSTSYCIGGTSGAPVAADGLACVLPIGQIASTAGRYILQLSATGLDVRQIGMVGDGVFDNSSLNITLLNFINPVAAQSSQSNIQFAQIPGQRYTNYFFSKPLHLTRFALLQCQGNPSSGGDASTRLVFPAGVHGVVWDSFGTAPPPIPDGIAGGQMVGCGVVSKGYHNTFPITTGSNATITVNGDFYFNTWNWSVGDGIIPYLYTPANGAPAIPGGSFVTAANSGTHVLTLNTPIVSPYTGNGNSVWRLPVANAFTVQTTIGSPTVTVTAGPSPIMPGDFMWSDAFPFGTTVLSVSGTAGAQTLTMAPYSLNGPTTTNATVTHAAGAPGKMWIIPAAVKVFTQISMHNNWLGTFGFGLEMECSQWGTPRTGCNASSSMENLFEFDIVGRMVMGDNAGASTSIANIYAYNSFADIVEGGAVGSSYFSENSNSSEDSTSLYGIVGECIGANSSSFFGGYAPTSGGYCTNNQLGAGTTPGGAVAFLFPQTSVPIGAPTIFNNNFYNNWFFLNPSYGITLCMNKPGDILAWSRDGQNCGGPETWTVGWTGFGAWDWQYFSGSGGNTMFMTEGALGGYTGYKAGNLALMSFQQGLLLYDAEAGGGGIGLERLVDEGGNVPAAGFHKEGDIHFNNQSGVGGFSSWVNTAGASSYLNTAVAIGDPSLNVLYCLSPTPAVGTPILYWNDPAHAAIGTFASCSGNTLTLQAPATIAVGTGNLIVSTLWRAAGPLADDTTGTHWELGNYMTLTPVALASLPATCTAGTFAVINNGVAAPVYNAAVGSTTGAATDPVFCAAGNIWTYH